MASLPTTVLQTTTDAISPIINEGVLKPLAAGILEGKITGTTVEELAAQMRTHLSLTEPSKVQVRTGIPSAIKSAAPVTSIDGFMPEKNGNRYVTDPTKTCAYVFKKGNKANQRCERHSLKGFHMCSNHWRNANKKGGTTTLASAAAPLGLPPGRVPGMAARPAAAPQIKLRPHKPEAHLYLTEIAGIGGSIMVHYDPAKGQGVAMKVVSGDDPGGDSRDLTSEEKTLANNVGLSTPTSEIVTVDTRAAGLSLAPPPMPIRLPTTAPISAVSIPTATGIPSAAGLAMPTSLPTVSSLATAPTIGMSLATAPTIGMSLATAPIVGAPMSLATAPIVGAPMSLAEPMTVPITTPTSGSAFPIISSVPPALPSVTTLTNGDGNGNPPALAVQKIPTTTGHDLSGLAAIVGGS